ncbi:PTS sugar transporter subunit IIA [Salinibacterium sp. NG22]|uniref:PTS sugar transporter subunit IIA n=1 Tax=Salinibacterium sp. NG22 TaxID=2792040 RepID=UPI0018CCE138|nr:PTS sugar transporter subunit IIA [Salinibacterium sp. NG22]MBH0109599.1 PTS sugar transporter subunit IIA [Salinibacterium sp. NG22]
MLTDYLTPSTINFAENVEGWRAAIALVAQPLLESGSITTEYVDSMTDSIAGGGTYIDLGFGIALAHSRPEDGVVRTGLSSLRVTPPVLLNDEAAHPIDQFFCLAAIDAKGHIETMQELAGLLSDDELRSELLAAQTSAEVTAVLHKIGTP